MKGLLALSSKPDCSDADLEPALKVRWLLMLAELAVCCRVITGGHLYVATLSSTVLTSRSGMAASHPFIDHVTNTRGEVCHVAPIALPDRPPCAGCTP